MYDSICEIYKKIISSVADLSDEMAKTTRVFHLYSSLSTVQNNVLSPYSFIQETDFRQNIIAGGMMVLKKVV